MLSSLRSFFSAKDSQPAAGGYEVIMLGLRNAGKTAIVYQLKLHDFITTILTHGFNTETITVPGLGSGSGSGLRSGSLEFTIWDLGGACGHIKFWHRHLKGCPAMIFVVDSTDVDYLIDASDALRQEYLNNDVSREAVLLVFANKQDHPNARSVAEVKDRLGLDRMYRDQCWHIQGSSARTGEGLLEGLIWMDTQLRGCRCRPDRPSWPQPSMTGGSRRT